MICVYCFSGSGRSRAAAEYFAEEMNVGVSDIGKLTQGQKVCETAVVVFPVYCQNIPDPIRRFLKELRAKYVVLVATYGRISYGNVLWEAKKLVCGEVIAGAYVPMGHSMLREEREPETAPFSVILDRIRSPRAAVIPRGRKNIFADFFPALRSRLGVKMTRSSRCSECGICERECPMGAMKISVRKTGRNKSARIKTGGNCIRCLRCAYNCPMSVIDFKLSPVLAGYLSGAREDRLKIYL